MSNMSYCRFENTANALQDCVDAIDTMLQNNGKNEYGETLSEYEQRGFEDLIEICNAYAGMAEECLDNFGETMCNQ